MARLIAEYKEKVIAKMMEEFGYKNVMEVPRLKKIVLNMGLGDAVSNVKIIESAVSELTMITGQKVLVTKAKKDISNFKIRKGIPVGCMVTLRRNHMYEFFDRLVNVALPRVRDFRGSSPRGFDTCGNYTLGIKEQLIFPEINYDKIDKIRGLNITIVTSAKNKIEGKRFLQLMGLPFREKN